MTKKKSAPTSKGQTKKLKLRRLTIRDLDPKSKTWEVRGGAFLELAPGKSGKKCGADFYGG